MKLSPRIFYGCELHPGAIDELLGINPHSEAIGNSVVLIAALWRQRWLAKRIQNAEILNRVAAGNAETVATFFSENVRDGAPEKSTESQSDFDFGSSATA
jgi:hypothetical protein